MMMFKKMGFRNFWKKWNEVVFAPFSLLVFALAYYGVYIWFGPEAGLIPPGYFTGVLAGACIMYIGGWMASLAVKLNFPHFFKILFVSEIEYVEKERTALCVYFGYYALSIWALTSML
jgi:hypothetical protein